MESRYKAKSAATGNIDGKSLRVHRRSNVQRTAREDIFDRRRNLQLSPLIDEAAVSRISHSKKGIAVKGQTTKPVKSGGVASNPPTAPQPPKNDRREMLKRWKEEKELKKKLDQQKAAQKRIFKVHHVEYKDSKLYSNERGASKTTSGTSSQMPRSSARLANRPTEDKRQTASKPVSSTRAKRNHVAPETKPMRSSTRLASKAATNSTTASTLRKTSNSKHAVPETKPLRSSTRLASKAPATTSTASTSRKRNNSKKQPTETNLPATKADTKGENTAMDDAKPVTDANPFVTNFGNVTKRGDDTTLPTQEYSFAPADFKFRVPSNVSSFAFKPLSPGSTSAFFGVESRRRISTPHKHSGNLTLFSPDVSVIKGNSDSQSDDSAPAPAVALFANGPKDEVFGAKPKLRRSVRFGNQPSADTRGTSSSSTSEESDMDQESHKPRRASRRSVSFAADPDEPAMKTPRSRKLSGRKSTPFVKSSEKRVRIADDIDKNEDKMEVDQAENVTPVVTRTRKISERKATPAATFHNCETVEEGDTPKLRRSRRQSGPKVADDQPEEADSGIASGEKQSPSLRKRNQEANDIAAKENTPTGRSRRPSGRRLTPAPKLANADGEEEMGVTPRRSKRISVRVATPVQDQKMEESTTKAVDSQEEKDAVAMDTQDGSGEQHDVPYFRRIVQNATEALNGLCNKWDEVKNDGEVTEDVTGQIFAAIGKAQLLMKERFGQFIGLIDDSEFHRGEKEVTCTDLQGFWDMVEIQVDNVHDLFNDLEKLKKNNWQRVEVVRPKAPKKTVVKKTKPVAAKSSKASEARAAAKKRLAEVKAAMKAKLADEAAAKSRAEEVKTFDAGFFKVSSPVKTPGKHCEAGTPSQKCLQSNTVSSSGRALSRLQSPLASNTATPQNKSKARLRRSLCQKNTPEKSADCDNFAKYLMPSRPVDSPALVVAIDTPANVSVVDLNLQAEEFMKTEPTQQLNDLKMRSPLKTRHAVHGCNSPVSANKSLSDNFSKLTMKSNTPTQAKMDSENYLFTPFEKSTLSNSTFDDSLNLISFDSPSGQANKSQANASDTLTNGLFSPIHPQATRRSTRRSTANPNPGIFSPVQI